MNELIIRMVELFYYDGPLTNDMQNDREIKDWLNSRTEQDGELLLQWVQEHKGNDSLYQPGTQWDDETSRMAIECAGKIAARLSSDRLRRQIELMIGDASFREDALNGLKQIASDKSLDALFPAVGDERYVVVHELGSVLAAINTPQALALLDQLIDKYNGNSWFKSTLVHSRNHAGK